MTSEAAGSKAKLSVNVLLRKVHQYKNYLEDYKKRYNETRDQLKSLLEKNSNLVKENATLRQSVGTLTESITTLKEEAISYKEAMSTAAQTLEAYKTETERKMRQYEQEIRRRGSGGVGGLFNINPDFMAQRICAAIAAEMGNAFTSVVSAELKSQIHSSALDNQSPLLSPAHRTLRSSIEPPDSLQRFVSRAGHPRAASTPLRSGAVVDAINAVPQPSSEIPIEPTAAVLYRAVNPRPKANTNVAIPAIAEEDEENVNYLSDEEAEMQNAAPLPPLKPKPSRSAPVKGSKIKSNANLKPKSRSRVRVPPQPSASNNNESTRVLTKLHNGRVEARVGNSILQQADDEKKSRSLKRKQPVEAPKSKGPSIFDFSYAENQPDLDNEDVHLPVENIIVLPIANPTPEPVAIAEPVNEGQLDGEAAVSPVPIPETDELQQPSPMESPAVETEPHVEIQVPIQKSSDAEGKSRSNKRKQHDMPKRSKKGRTRSSDKNLADDVAAEDHIPIPEVVNQVEVEIIRPSSHSSIRPQSTQSEPDIPLKARNYSNESAPRGPSTDMDSDQEFGRSRPRRNKAIQSYAELPLNVKMRRCWDNENQQFVAFHR